MTVSPSLSERIALFERDLIATTLRDTNFNVRRTAFLLGVDRGRLYQKIRRFGISLDRQHRASVVAQDSE